MSTCLFGIEEELAVSGSNRHSRSVPVDYLATRLIERAFATLAYLADGAGRLFLANGSLLYLDCGSHPEVATPECTTPWEAVAYLRASERTLQELASDVCRADGLGEVRLARCNVDYLSNASWGCHESYLCRRPVADYVAQLVPHLVSRIIYTGSGGLDPRSAGAAFSLSPRLAHLQKVISHSSTGTRGIFHTKDESLSGRYHRLHVLAGDSACSDLATWLKVATTALIVAGIDTGMALEPLELVSPLEAMRTFAADPLCQARVETASCIGTQASAIEIQRHYLEAVRAHAATHSLPDWAPEACTRWGEVLTLLEVSPAALGTALDWPLKRRLLTDRIERRGHTWETVRAWTFALNALRRRGGEQFRRSGRGIDERAVQRLRAAGPRARHAVECLTRRLARHGLGWSGLDDFLDLRAELQALDVRFGVLDTGLFAELDRAGLLRHRVNTEGEIRAAQIRPPAVGRARIRGECVARLAAQRRRYHCDWQAITGPDQFLDLSDPLEGQERWRPLDGGR